jgi:hypothetical protein
MPGISRVIRQGLLDHLLLTGAGLTRPASIFVALYTVAPTATGGGTECVGAGYVRVEHATWVAATGAEPSVAVNNGVITFPVAGGAWGDIVAIGLHSAIAAGTFLAYGTITAKTIAVGDTASFASGSLSVSINETP